MTHTDRQDEIDNMYLPWPHHITDPFVGVACDDPRYEQVVAWADKTHSEYQAGVKAQLKHIAQTYGVKQNH